MKPSRTSDKYLAEAGTGFDVIVVLGTTVMKDGRPSRALRERVLQAVKLVRGGVSEHLLLTGGRSQPDRPSEAEVMERLAMSEGVKEDRIILEDTATSTLENAAASARIMRARGWTTAVVVTDRYHLMRSRLAFRHFGIRVAGSAPPASLRDIRHWNWWYLRIREVFACFWYLLRLHDPG